jgi:hypothetical protein
LSTPPKPKDVSRKYINYLTTRLAASADGASSESDSELRRDLEGLQLRMRSPRYRIADALGNALQRVPVVWPLVAAITERVQRRGAR